MPASVALGEQFTIKVGIKCEAGCSPDGWTLEVRDPEGETLAKVAARNDPWPETEGLFGSEVVLEAPEKEGEYRWEVIAPSVGAAADDGASPASRHAEFSGAFGFRVLTRGDSRLTVVAVARETQAPVVGARVVAHPYRAVTDGDGVAQLELPNGRYRLFVTGPGYLPFRIDAELAGDESVRAELERDREPSHAEVWS